MYVLRAPLVGQMVKNLLAMEETWVRSLGWEDPLEEGTATHSINLVWRITWTEEPIGLPSMGITKRVRHDWVTNTFTFAYSCSRTLLSSSWMSPWSPHPTHIPATMTGVGVGDQDSEGPTGLPSQLDSLWSPTALIAVYMQCITDAQVVLSCCN